MMRLAPWRSTELCAAHWARRGTGPDRLSDSFCSLLRFGIAIDANRGRESRGFTHALTLDLPIWHHMK